MPRQQVASDNFNRADEALGAPNWQQVVSSFGSVVIASQVIRGTNASSEYLVAAWVNNTFSSDQYAELDVDPNGLAWGDGTNVGLALRWNGQNESSRALYEFLWGSFPEFELRIARLAAGSRTVLASTSYSPGSTFRLEAEAEGSTLRLLVNGIVQLTATDTTLTSGRPGVVARSSSTTPRPLGDNWVAGNIVAGSVSLNAFRFFNDDGNENGSTAMAAQNTNVTVAPDGVFRVRVGIQATGDPAAQNFRLEFKRTTESIWRGVV